MRQVVKSQGLGDPSTAPTSCAIDVYFNAAQAQTVSDCTRAVMALDPQLSHDASLIWKTALADMAQGAALAGAVFVGIEIFEWAFAQIGLGAIAADIGDVFIGVILQIVNAILDALGLSALAATATGAAFGSVLGPIGALIGLIIGAIVGLVEYLDPSHLQVTSPPYGNGNTYSCQDYAQTNIHNAVQWLQNNPKICLGLTALAFGKQANIFIANPQWLWANQSMFPQMDPKAAGFSQPTPPDYGQGSAIDLCYSQLPGAYEALNCVQFSSACAFVGANPSQLGLFMTVLNPTSVAPKDDPLNNPFNWSSLWSAATPQGMLWVPGGWSAGVAGIGGEVGDQDANKKTNPNNWPSRQPGFDDHNASNPNGGNQYIYSSCPNLLTNDIITTSSGKLRQTNIAKNIFALQLMFPTLTVHQCLLIFQYNMPAYNDALSAAMAYANSVCWPRSDDLGPGSKFNLCGSDVTAILNAWVGPYGDPKKCPPHTVVVGGGTGTTFFPPGVNFLNQPTPVSSPAKRGAALVGGVGAIGLAFFAARHGLTIAEASREVYGRAATVAKRLARKVKK